MRPMILVLVVSVFGGSLWAAEPKTEKEAAAKAYEIAVAYTKKNVPDTEGLEFLEYMTPLYGKWRKRDFADVLNEEAGKETPKVAAQPACVIGIKFRAKNKLGAKTINETVFLIVKGEVKGLRNLSKTDRDTWEFVYSCMQGGDWEDGKWDDIGKEALGK